MKIKVIILGLLSTVIAFAAVGQENDDMYFNAKDRAKLRESKAADKSVVLARNDRKETKSASVNPTDSYSARNVNPEYTSRAVAETALQDSEDYFVTNYSLRNRTQFNEFNNSFNSWYNSPWYTASYWGAGYNRWNSWNNPYYGGAYGSYYDTWGSPFMNPYYRSGWSTSFSYMSGNGWGSGWGNSWGMGMGCPSNYWGSSYAYSPYYSPYYGGAYGYAPAVVVVERDRGYVYGKRSSRSNYVVTGNNNTPSQGRSAYTSTRGADGRNNTGGRVRTSSREADYYEHTMRNSSRQSGTTSGSSGTSNTSGRSATWDNDDNNSRSTYRNNTTPYNPPTRSTNWDNSGSRSSGSNSNSSSPSRSSRGRGN